MLLLSLSPLSHAYHGYYPATDFIKRAIARAETAVRARARARLCAKRNGRRRRLYDLLGVPLKRLPFHSCNSHLLQRNAIHLLFYTRFRETESFLDLWRDRCLLRRNQGASTSRPFRDHVVIALDL